MDILPNEPFRELYGEWLPLSPKFDDHITHKSGDKNIMASLHFFMEFSIPWIWKWSVKVDYTPHKIPSLQRLYHTKFWPKMLQINPETKSPYGQQVIDDIKNQIKKYQDLKKFSKVSQENIPKPGMSKEEMLKSFRRYCIQMKENLKEMEASSSKSDENSLDNMSMEFLAGESQADDEEIPLECMIDMIEESLTRGKNLSKDKKPMQYDA